MSSSADLYTTILQGTRVVYVDENPINRNLAQLIFSDLGSLPLCVASFQEMLEAITRRGLDIAVIDQSTIEQDASAYSILRRDPRMRDIPVIIVGNNEEDARNQKADFFIPAPLDAQLLVEQLENARSLSTNREGPINRTSLLSRCGGQQDQAAEILKSFIQSYSNWHERLHSAVAENNTENLIGMLRSLRSIASAVGANTLYRVAAEIQSEQEDGQPFRLGPLEKSLDAAIRFAKLLLTELKIDNASPKKGKKKLAAVVLEEEEEELKTAQETAIQKTKNRPLVLVVDDSKANLAYMEDCLSDEYEVASAESGEACIARSQQVPRPHVILLDVTMPGMNGYETCKILKEDPRTNTIPVIFLTSLTSQEDEETGLAIGAADYIRKPFSVPVLKARIKSQVELVGYRNYLEHQVEERTRELLETQREVVYRLAQAAEYRDTDTGVHIKRIGYYAMSLAEHLGFPRPRADILYYASFMHDVGKIGIPDNILLKPGKLDPDEWEVMKQHTVIGARMLEGHPSELLETAALVALSHHERWDGKGYPAGLSGTEIPLEGRIVAICDVFDALLSVRPYKKAWTYDETLDEINRLSGTHFDPEIVRAFNDLFEDFIHIKEELRD